MRIGFASIYAYRPHVEHVYWLASLMQERGHDVSYLSCDAALSHCYTKALRDVQGRGIKECVKCTAGGVRSFTGERVDSMRQYMDKAGAAAAIEAARPWSFSSVCTILRTESEADKDTQEFRELHERLTQGAAEAFAAATRWIEARKLDAIVCFNGRMESTRALLEAARAKGIPFISIERTWFGDGLLMIPDENCLGLAEVDQIVAAYRDTPLTEAQARRVAALLASRFLRVNTLEWRAYNQNAVECEWPAQRNGLKLLITPSSLNEFDGHPDWRTHWPDQIAALDSLFDELGVDPASCILRCHPNWGETIGRRTGVLPETMYTDWARRRGVHVIPSHDRTSTLGLIPQADVIVVNGGSAAFEAGALGKQIVALGTSIYQKAGFQITYCGPEDKPNLALIGRQSPRDIASKVLRFAYTFNFRFYQYVEDVRAETTTVYRYNPDAEAAKLEQLIERRHVSPDTEVIAANADGENRVLDFLEERDWAALSAAQPPIPENFARVSRRGLFRTLDGIRARLRHGDR